MTHDVQFNVPNSILGNADIKIRVKADEELLGVLKISKGALVWFPKNNKRGHIVSWSQFDNYMKKRPKKEKR